MEQVLFGRVFYSAFFPLTVLVTALAYFYSMSFPDMEYVIGDHELVMSWYFTAVSLFSFGVLQGLYYAVKTIVFLGSFIFGRYVFPLQNRRVRMAFCSLSCVLLLFIPSAIVAVVVFLYSLLASIARVSAQSNRVCYTRRCRSMF